MSFFTHGVVDVWCGGCLMWWMSGVVDVWCGGCPILPLVWWMSSVVDFWCGGCLFLHMVWWISGVVDVWLSVWWMSYNHNQPRSVYLRGPRGPEMIANNSRWSNVRENTQRWLKLFSFWFYTTPAWIPRVATRRSKKKIESDPRWRLKPTNR